jgi:hypothetical protein
MALQQGERQAKVTNKRTCLPGYLQTREEKKGWLLALREPPVYFH